MRDGCTWVSSLAHRVVCAMIEVEELVNPQNPRWESKFGCTRRICVYKQISSSIRWDWGVYEVDYAPAAPAAPGSGAC
jgi:hypothetical protein